MRSTAADPLLEYWNIMTMEYWNIDHHGTKVYWYISILVYWYGITALWRVGGVQYILLFLYILCVFAYILYVLSRDGDPLSVTHVMVLIGSTPCAMIVAKKVYTYTHTCIHAYMHTCILAYMHTCIYWVQ